MLVAVGDKKRYTHAFGLPIRGRDKNREITFRDFARLLAETLRLIAVLANRLTQLFLTVFEKRLRLG